MNDNTVKSCANLADLSRDEKREIWMKRNGFTVTSLASFVGVVPATLSRTLRNATMPVAQHEKLVRLGMPAEILPAPLDKKTGPAPRQLPVTHAPALSA